MGRIFNLDSPLFTFLNRVADLIWLNVLTLICCIPVITVGASLTALNYVVLKMVRNEEGYLTRAFFKSFKQNFRQATLIWLVILAVIAILAGDFYIFQYSAVTFPSWMKTALFAVIMILLIAVMHVFPVLSRFENTVKNTFRNSFFMGILSLPKTLLMIVCWAVPVIVGLSFFQIFPLVLMLGISGPAYVSALLYNKTFKRFEPAEDTEEDMEEDTGILSENGEIEQ